MPVTQRQIAQAMGLSRSLVGEALSGSPRIAVETRERIVEMARAMGYDSRANDAARSLIARRYGNQRRTNVLGLVLGSADITKPGLGPHVFAGVLDEARQREYDLLVMAMLPQHATDRLASLTQDSRIDGLVLVNFFQLKPALEAFVAAGLPTVTCLSDDNPETIPSIMIDNRGAMQLAVGHLAERGHRAIVHLEGTPEHSDARQRTAGFLTAMAAAGLSTSPEPIIPGTWGSHLIGESADNILARKATAVVCSNDGGALALWRELEGRGLRIPQDISLVGMDDIPRLDQPPLTSVPVPWVQLGRAAARSLMDLVSGAPAADLSRILPVCLMERQSVAPPPPFRFG